MRKVFFVLLTAAAVSVGFAQSGPAKKAEPTDPRAAIAKKFPGAKVEDIAPSPIEGLFELRLGSDIGYVSADGRYLISGDLFDIDSRTNLTEASRADVRRRLLAELDEKDMIVFAPPTVKHTVTVFTDVECGYCRRLHAEIDQINKLGVSVRYVAYPRSGPGSPDWQKMEAVWCSKDRRTAITRAKRGEEVKAQRCGATPVAHQYELGEQMGVRGTPAIFTQRGDYIGGYLPPDRLLQQLEALAKQR